MFAELILFQSGDHRVRANTLKIKNIVQRVFEVIYRTFQIDR
ncbi:hypothetical protein VIBR0546_07637 [Vibrio brasiliensis LMG 20546]|uniref:Uncharacterized protein n=1 Tax=Vibrio brasiliensis LMG 20546 TaxID=945543 RepID=E8LUS8_9VIBR|nr:hypothetical protein VIBR0546_07637 [Vibrio brasiliensis LMG 20546]